MLERRWNRILILYAAVVVLASFIPQVSDFVCKPVAIIGAWPAFLLLSRCLKAPRYYSGMIAQMAIVLLLAAVVLVASGITDTIATILLLFLIHSFIMQPHFLVAKAARSLMRGDHSTALSIATRLRTLWWGKQSELHTDHIEFTIAVVNQKWATAGEILSKWKGDHSIPPSEQNRVCGLESELFTQQHKWPKVIETYAIESLKEPAQASVAVFLNSARAYAETGHFEESVTAMEKLRMNMLLPELAALTRIWISCVAAFGDSEHLENLFDGIELTEDRLDDFEKNVWRSRCSVTIGQLENAKQLLSLSQKQIVALPDAKQTAPKAKSMMNEIHYIDRLVSNNYCGPLSPPTTAQLDRVKAVWSKIRTHATSRR